MSTYMKGNFFFFNNYCISNMYFLHLKVTLDIFMSFALHGIFKENRIDCNDSNNYDHDSLKSTIINLQLLYSNIISFLAFIPDIDLNAQRNTSNVLLYSSTLKGGYVLGNV